MRIIRKKIEKKDAHGKIGSHGGKMTGDTSRRSKRIKHSHRY